MKVSRTVLADAAPLQADDDRLTTKLSNLVAPARQEGIVVPFGTEAAHFPPAGGPTAVYTPGSVAPEHRSDEIRRRLVQG